MNFEKETALILDKIMDSSANYKKHFPEWTFSEFTFY